MVILDTNIIIDHLRRPTGQSFLMRLVQNQSKQNLAISVISVQELYEGQSTKVREKEQFLLATISPLKILTYNYEIAQKAGQLARDLKRPIELADAAIAATALVNKAMLFTLNQKHFQAIKNLELFNLS